MDNKLKNKYTGNNMKAKLSDFNAYLNEQVGQPYLWGGQHTKLTPSNYISVINRKESAPKNRAVAIEYCKKKFDAGETVLYAYDCSGLGTYYLYNLEHIISADTTANGLMTLCDPAEKPAKGYWVFRVDDNGKATHVGYMASDSEVIHAKGRAYGVVREKYKSSYWHKVGQPGCFDFSEPEPEPEPPEPTVQIAVKGTVRVREGNGGGKKICTVGERGKVTYLPYLGQAPESPYWYMTRVNDQDGYITSKPKYTEVIEVTL